MAAGQPIVDAKAERRFRSLPLGLLVLALGLGSLVPRLSHLDEPLLEANAFRQTQTAMTVWSMAKGSMSPFLFETPVLGPPWRLPLEFPTFQLSAAALRRLGVEPVEVAARAAGVAWFVLSSVMLYALCCVLLDRPRAASVWLVYMLTPFTMRWGRTAMIDFASVAMSLGYLLAVVLWLRHRPAPWLLALALGLGVMAYLTKITTVPTVMPALALLSLAALRDATNRTPMLVGLGLAALVPLAAGLAWTLWAADVRSGSELTKDLTSSMEWFFGTWEHRVTASRWAQVLAPLPQVFMPGPLALLLPLGLWPERERDARLFVYGMVGAAVMTVFVFHSLYFHHEYYWMAVAPALCIAMGLGLHRIVMVALAERPVARATAIAVVLLCYWLFAWPLTRDRWIATPATEVMRVAKLVRWATARDELVVIADFNWNPAILFHARRRGLMLRPKVENERTNALLAAHPFRTVVVVEEHPTLFSTWRYKREIGRVGQFRVFRVGDDPALLELPPGRRRLARG